MPGLGARMFGQSSVVTTAVATFLIVYLLGLLPVIHYLIFGHRERRRDILAYFTPNEINSYFERFCYAEAEAFAKAPVKEFQNLYDRRFGRRVFVLPTAVYLLSLAGAASAIVCGTLIKSALPIADEAVRLLAVYAIAGAYVWVIFDLLVRCQQRDLVPN